MSCEHWEEQIQNHLDGELDEAQWRALEGHLAECEPCARLYDEMRALDAWAQDLPLEATRADFTDTVMARIEEEKAPALWQTAVSIALPLAITAIVAIVALPAVMAAVDTMQAWWFTGVDTATGYADAVAADFEGAGRDLATAAEPIASSLGTLPVRLSTLWLSVAAGVAFLMVLAVNFAQARAWAPVVLSRRRQFVG